MGLTDAHLLDPGAGGAVLVAWTIAILHRPARVLDRPRRDVA